MRETKIVNISDFTTTPKGRYRRSGQSHSAEEFWIDHLLPATISNQFVSIDVSGVEGLPASWIDELCLRLMSFHCLEAAVKIRSPFTGEPAHVVSKCKKTLRNVALEKDEK